MSRKVGIGFFGTNLDGGTRESRWTKWRPTISLCQQEDLLLDVFELLYSPPHRPGAERVAADIAQISPETEVRLRELSIEDPWDFEEVFAALHDFASGYPFEEELEEYLVHITTGSHVMQICFFLLTESRHLPARLVQTAPPGRHVDGPGSYRIIDLDLSRYDRLATRFHREHEESLSFLKSGIETRNAAFNRLIERVERVALRCREPILLMGPTGAGKSQLARQIYELKRARKKLRGPFVEINCATLRGDGAMSTLFGHVKGAYTGASRDREGLLRAAQGGLLFLDEIAELGLDEQAMLLRAIEDKRFLPVGTDREASSEFELITGTNSDLRQRVAQGRFREDLLARIDLWTFMLPALRERLEDLEPNLEYELDRAGRKLGQRVSMNREARERFLTLGLASGAEWRGNFRDLNAAILRMAILAPGARIDVATVQEEFERLREAWRRPGGEARAGAERPGTGDRVERVLGERAATLDPFDRVQLEEVLRVCERSRSLAEAGRHLFRFSRERKRSSNDADRLRKYLSRYELRFAELVAE